MNIDFSNSQLSNATIGISETGDVNQGRNVTVYNFTNQTQTLTIVAHEMQELLNQLTAKNSISTTMEQNQVAKLVLAKVNERPQLRERLRKVLQSGGKEALREMIDHPLINVVLAMIDSWQKNNS